MQLLLIEDDNTTVESVKLCLEIYEPNSRIKSTGKGLEALRMLQNEAFDAVLIDLGLPDIDGIEVIEKLRTFSQIPAVVLSARHSPDVIAKALTLGADDYITKPFDYRLLLKRLHNLVEKKPDDRSSTK
jgi:DNA-binding response OmpR family regulator